jgi:peptide/nickel transport system substrate-binding protein
MGRISRRKFLKRGAGISALLLGAGALAPTSAALAAPTRSKRELVVGTFGDPENLNPILRWDIPNSIVGYNIFDNLALPDYKTRGMKPRLAESWRVVDPLTWQIKLREGVQWHKGYGEVTAEDLAYTWNYTIDNKTNQYAGALSPVRHVRMTGKYVVEVKLKQPFGAFPGVTIGYGGLIVSKKAHMEMGNNKYARNPIGTGPFMLESWTPGAEVVLTRNPQYWQRGRPYLDKLVYRVIPDSQVRLLSLQKGEVDLVFKPDVKSAQEVKKDPSIVHTSTPGWNWDFQQFNLMPDKTPPDFPTRNKLVRQAMSYAIDREAIRQQIYYGEATVTDTPIPEGFLGYHGHVLRYPRSGDLKRARELMAKAGVRGFEVEVITSDLDWLRRELELVAGMMSQIGITYKIRGLDMGTFNHRWFGDFNYVQLLEDVTIVSPDPDSCLWWFYNTKGDTDAGYNVPEMDRLTDEARAESDSKKREALYYRAVDLALEDCPLIFHVNVNYVRLYKKGLVGYEPGPQDYVELFRDVHWE